MGESPDAATFMEIFSSIKDPCVAKLSDHEFVAIDGKILRRAWHKHQGGEVVHMVNAWANSNRMILT